MDVSGVEQEGAKAEEGSSGGPPVYGGLRRPALLLSTGTVTPFGSTFSERGGTLRPY
jgi:hypothetical protein